MDVAPTAGNPLSRPSPAELAEKHRQEIIGDESSKDGESELDWAWRVLKKGDQPHTAGKVLKALASLKVDETRREEVGEVLVAFGRQSQRAWHLCDDLIKAMEVWSTAETSRFLIRQLAEPSWKKKDLLYALAKNPSEEAARAVALLMTDPQCALDVSAALREMGPVAEKTVLKQGDSDTNSTTPFKKK